MRDRRIAVIGGGLAGLSAGYALARRGARVVVYEASSRLGGRAITDDLDGASVDPGAQLFGSMYTRFLSLVREIGLEHLMVRVPGRDALWRDGRAHEVVYGSVASMASSGGLPFRTKMRLAATYVPFLARHSGAFDIHAPERAARDGLDGESIADWGHREIDDGFIDFLVSPQLGAYYLSTPEETSAGFYHLLARYGMDVDLYAVSGGVGQVAERLAERIREAGGEIRLSAPVAQVRGSRGVSIIAASGEEGFDGVVCSVPATLSRAMLVDASAPLADWLEGVRYRPAHTLILLLEEPVRRRYFGLSFPRGENRYVAAIAIQDAKGVRMAGDGRGILIAFPTPESADAGADLESRAILERMLPEIEAALPEVAGKVVRARVHRWPVGSPIMYPGYLSHLGRFRDGSMEGDVPIVLAGDYLYGPSVEGAVSSGLEAVTRLSARFS